MAFDPATDVATYLRTQLGASAPLVTVQGLPGAPDAVFAVLAHTFATVQAMGPTEVAQQASFQVIGRNSRSRSRELETSMQTIHTLLQVLRDVTMGGTPYALVEALGEPAFLGTDANGRPLWSANYHVIRDPE